MTKVKRDFWRSHNHRIVGVGRDSEISQGATSRCQSMVPRVNCTGRHPYRSLYVTSTCLYRLQSFIIWTVLTMIMLKMTIKIELSYASDENVCDSSSEILLWSILSYCITDANLKYICTHRHNIFISLKVCMLSTLVQLIPPFPFSFPFVFPFHSFPSPFFLFLFHLPTNS